MDNVFTGSGQKAHGNRFTQITFTISFFLLTVSATWSLAVRHIVGQINKTVAETVVNVANGPAFFYYSSEGLNLTYILIGIFGFICIITAIIMLIQKSPRLKSET